MLTTVTKIYFNNFKNSSFDIRKLKKKNLLDCDTVYICNMELGSCPQPCGKKHRIRGRDQQALILGIQSLSCVRLFATP